jgi:predicted nucleotidyltransferase
MIWEDDVWQILDRKQLADIVRRVSGVLFTTVSGAHLYGFASADSDVDLRGVFLLPVENLIGLHEPKRPLRQQR